MPPAPAPVVALLSPSDFCRLAPALTRTVFPFVRVDKVAAILVAPASLVVCDTEHFDWREVLSHVKDHSPVVLLTETSDRRIWAEMLQAGAADVVQKPWDASDLQWVLSCTAGRSKSMAAAA